MSPDRFEEVARRLDIFAKEYATVAGTSQFAAPLPGLVGRAWLVRVAGTVPLAVFADGTWSFLYAHGGYQLVAPETVRDVVTGTRRPEVVAYICTEVLRPVEALSEDEFRTGVIEALDNL